MFKAEFQVLVWNPSQTQTNPLLYNSSHHCELGAFPFFPPCSLWAPVALFLEAPVSLRVFTPLFLCRNVWCRDSAYVDVSISKPCMCCIAKQLLATLISRPYAIWKRGLDKEMCQGETKAHLRKRWLNCLREMSDINSRQSAEVIESRHNASQVVIRKLWERWHILYPLASSLAAGSRTWLYPIAWCKMKAPGISVYKLDTVPVAMSLF